MICPTPVSSAYTQAYENETKARYTYLLPRLQVSVVIGVVFPDADECALVVVADCYASLAACVELVASLVVHHEFKSIGLIITHSYIFVPVIVGI